jgi:hypothetical protein
MHKASHGDDKAQVEFPELSSATSLKKQLNAKLQPQRMAQALALQAQRP